MDKNIEQRICLKFCIAYGISCAESLKMLEKAYGESTLSKNVRKGHKLNEYHRTNTVFTWYGFGRLFSFSKIQIIPIPLQGTRFQSIEDIKENSRRELKSIPENAFKKSFEDSIIRWNKCIISGGAYFEGNKINLDE